MDFVMTFRQQIVILWPEYSRKHSISNFPWLVYLPSSFTFLVFSLLLTFIALVHKDKILFFKVLAFHPELTWWAPWVKKKKRKTATFVSVSHVSAESQRGLQQHLRRPHQTCNFLKPALMLGMCLSLAHVWGCVVGPQSFSMLPHEMLIPPSCTQSPQLASEKWLQQLR